MLRSALRRIRTDPSCRLVRRARLEDARGRVVDHEVSIEPAGTDADGEPFLLVTARPRNIAAAPAGGTAEGVRRADANGAPDAPGPDATSGTGESSVPDDPVAIAECRSTGRDPGEGHRYRRDLEALIGTLAAPVPDRDLALSRILRVGIGRLGLGNAILSRHEGDACRIVAIEGPLATRHPPGTVLAPAGTYGEALPPPGAALVAANVGEGPLATHPTRAATGLEAYAGTRLSVAGEPFGSASFSSAGPSARAFDLADERFLLLISGWMANLLGAADPREPIGGGADGTPDPAPRTGARETGHGAPPPPCDPPPPVPENARLDRFAHALSHELRAARAEVDVGPLPTPPADAALVRLLFTELVANAVEYRDPARPCRIRILAPPGAVFQVEDDGTGFEPGQGRRILEPFTRLSTSGARERSGMGLAVCVAACVRHGWTLTARGRPGVGATFRVEPDAAGREAASQGAAGRDGTRSG